MEQGKGESRVCVWRNGAHHGSCLLLTSHGRTRGLELAQRCIRHTGGCSYGRRGLARRRARFNLEALALALSLVFGDLGLGRHGHQTAVASARACGSQGSGLSMLLSALGRAQRAAVSQCPSSAALQRQVMGNMRCQRLPHHKSSICDSAGSCGRSASRGFPPHHTT